MRIAFVGKGGSGKTTTTSLFSMYVSKYFEGNIFVVDADLNMHMAEQLGIEVDTRVTPSLSDPKVSDSIRTYLIGNNNTVASHGHFKKTTPPAKGSSIINLSDAENYIFKNFSTRKGNIYLSSVGTYSEEKIGKSCYHDSLAIFENILTHTDDRGSLLIADMVAGIDSFANTLHMQFDILVFCVEPTKKSVDVYLQYESLAKKANVSSNVFVVVNKVTGEGDMEFVKKYIPEEKILGAITMSDHIRKVEREEASLSFDEMEDKNKNVIKKILETLKEHVIDPNERLTMIHKLHKAYVEQAYVKDRFGDLTGQIDESFHY